MKTTTLTTWYHWLAFGFGSGLAKTAPGTWGTLAALPFCFLIAPLDIISTSILLAVAFVFGIFISGKTAVDLKVKDHPGIVWDEFVGLWVTLFMVPLTVTTCLLGFALFRLFDIWKPWPIKLLDRHVEGGFGIMVDDLLAGIFAWLVLNLILTYFPL